MKLAHLLLSVSLLGFQTLLPGCTSGSSAPKLSHGRPVLTEIGAPSTQAIDRIEITARFPSIPSWTLRLEKDGSGVWRVASRSDLPEGGGDLADARLVEHFLEVLASFTTEAASPDGNDESFGMSPYRFEARISGAGATKILRLGDLTGPTDIYFRVGDEKSNPTWTGRGALIPFLPSIESPENFVSKSPFVVGIPKIQKFTLEKLEGKDRGKWTFLRKDDRWTNQGKVLDAEASARIERVARQRVDHLVLGSEIPDFSHPDWRISADSESLELVFLLNDVFGKNPTRSNRALVLYPEFAGALRAFTHARFTPERSGTK